jgi:hypothetical protein
VPRITLVDKLRGTHKSGQIGRPTVLSKVEEEVLVEMIQLMGEYNYPLTKRHLKDMVKNYLDKHRDTRSGVTVTLCTNCIIPVPILLYGMF